MRLGIRAALTPPYAQMLESVDKPVSETGAERHAGSSPALCTTYTFLAQLVEQRSFKPQVAGSSPAGRTICVLSSVGRATDC